MANRCETNIATTAAQGVALCEMVGAPNVPVHLDTYHMNIVETGAASGIGLACAEAMLAAGAQVVLIDRDSAKLGALCEPLGPNAHPLVVDLLDKNAVSAKLPQIRGLTGGLDILHLNAGACVGGPVAAPAAARWRPRWRRAIRAPGTVCAISTPTRHFVRSARGWRT